MTDSTTVTTIAETVTTGVAVAERNGWGLIRITGTTRQNFLHNQTSNNFKALQVGRALHTVWLTATARVIDLVTVLADDEAYWMLTSPERRAILLNWMPRFVFFMDNVQFHDDSDKYAVVSLYGPQSAALLTQTGASLPEPMAHAVSTVAGVEGVRILGDSGLALPGYTLFVPQAGREAVLNALTQGGAVVMSAGEWESLRISQGRPAADKELTEDYNPLEVGLWRAVSFSKGCYIGQEIVARLDTYQKLKQQLWGLKLSAPVTANTPLTLDNSDVGIVTSVTMTPDGPFALGFVRTKAGGAGLTLQAGAATAEVVEIPFVTRGRTDM